MIAHPNASYTGEFLLPNPFLFPFSSQQEIPANRTASVQMRTRNAWAIDVNACHHTSKTAPAADVSVLLPSLLLISCASPPRLLYSLISSD